MTVEATFYSHFQQHNQAGFLKQQKAGLEAGFTFSSCNASEGEVCYYYSTGQQKNTLCLVPVAACDWLRSADNQALLVTCLLNETMLWLSPRNHREAVVLLSLRLYLSILFIVLPIGVF